MSLYTSQGGGIYRYPDAETGRLRYYWYGVRYAEARKYREAPVKTYSRCTFEAVTCYSSDDFVNWHYEGDVLTRDEVTRQVPAYWVGRMGVAYLAECKKYVMVIQQDNGVLFALSDSPTGNFVRHRRITMENIIGTPNTGDQTVFVDEDTGKSYLIYSYGRGRNRIYISEIGFRDGVVDLLDCVQYSKVRVEKAIVCSNMEVSIICALQICMVGILRLLTIWLPMIYMALICRLITCV